MTAVTLFGAPEREPLDLTGALPEGRTVIEASAGTGKTYALSALAVRYVAERGDTAAELLMVTFTRAAAAELRERTRATLLLADEMLRTGGDPPPNHPWMAVLHAVDDAEQRERARRVHDAVTTFDDATITTIHGYCQQALRQIGLRAGTPIGTDLAADSAALIAEVCNDLLVAVLVDDPDALSWHKSDGELNDAGGVLTALVAAVTTMLNNPGATAIPELVTSVPSARDRPERLARWCALVTEARAEVLRRRTARREMAFDDLVTGLLDAVRDPVSGTAVVHELRSRHRRVLVDEFQDTDPVQWQVFERVFGDRLVIVGDPKQAIYRFRGADVHAYLAATEGARTFHLDTNRRSDADLVTATNTLVRGVRLGHSRIVATAVHAAPNAVARSLGDGPPLRVRHLPKSEELLTRKGQVSAPLSRHAILGDLTRVVADLLDGGHDLTPGDIAVLVPNHANAESVYEALNRAGIPAVRTRTGSVLATQALAEWQRFLAALERPSHAPTVRAAALGAFMLRDVTLLDPKSRASEPLLAELQRRCVEWAEQLGTRPLLAWYDGVRAGSGLVERLLAQPGGERLLTDLDHVAELLAAELGGRGHSVPSVRRRLQVLAAAAMEESDPQMRRIDSDAKAVQITTLHASKGLEYPVVLLPFSWQTPSNRSPWVFQAEQGRLVDVASGQDWEEPALREDDFDLTDDLRKHAAAVEARGDQLRLLYVGLTRAQRRTVVWWAPVGSAGAATSALGTVLLGRDDEGEPLNADAKVYRTKTGAVKTLLPKVALEDHGAAAHLARIAARSEGTIAVEACPPSTPAVRWLGGARVGEAPLAVADPAGRALMHSPWKRWSFTSLTRTAAEEPPGFVPTGGTDEPPIEEGLAVGEPVVDSDQPAALGRVPLDLPMMGVAGGAAFGTFVHGVLEHIDPTVADLEAHLSAVVGECVAWERIVVDEPSVVAGLAAAIRTPLGPIADDRSLADIAPADRLTELRFDLPFAGAVGQVAAVDIGNVLLATLPRGDALRGYAGDLVAGRFATTLAGYLQGSIDAVLRVPDGLFDHRYVVVDYKTNWLHERDAVDPLAVYRPDLLVDAMTHSDYPLQALLYSVALHRYLRWRLPGYDPRRHLGGIAYLFVRGMVGPDTPRHGGVPHGVFAWRPPAETVLGLDRLFVTGVAT